MNALKNPSRVPADGDQPIEDVPLFKRKRILVPLLLLTIAVVAAAWFWYVRHNKSIATDDAFIDADHVSISSRVPGRIIFLGADEGDTVRMGDTVVRLDDTDLRAQLLKAEAAYRTLTSNVQVTKVKKDRAIEDYSRIEKQYNDKIISLEQYLHAVNDRKLAEAQNDAAATQIATAFADLAIVRAQIANTVITAPFAGVIAKRWLLAGDVVSPAQAILSLYDNRHCRVTANFEEAKLRYIAPGLPVSVNVDAFPGFILYGTVESIGQTTVSQFSLIPPNNASGNFTKISQRVPVRIALDSAGQSLALLPGLSALVRVYLR